MRIVTVRRVSQIFFLLLFLWFCLVSTLGTNFWQLRGWPLDWFLELDPLVGLGTILTTGTIHGGLVWGLLTIVLTLLLGRFFCGWLCPFGTLQQVFGYFGSRKKSAKAKRQKNTYHKAQCIKYWLLVFLLTAAAGDLLLLSFRASQQHFTFIARIIAMAVVMGAFLVVRSRVENFKKAGLVLTGVAGAWVLLGFFIKGEGILAASLQTGLLDPIPLIYRSINLMLLPMVDSAVLGMSPAVRLYSGAWFIGALFLGFLLLCLKIPRFYCRYICPLGALFGVLGRWAIYRMGKSETGCKTCHMCEKACEGACQPSTQIRIAECVLCMNCIGDCPKARMGYHLAPSAAGEITSPDLTRRGMLVSVFGGAALIPMTRIGGAVGPNWNPAVLRPPGSLNEADFLLRCVKCGLCMRVCPTNVIQPAVFEAGLEGLWTPVLNFRIGTSGCQHNCIACGHLCPTAAIRPLSLDERMGRKAYKAKGPIRTGTAFIDRGRCLPWAMDRPCIVCQENCPVSPKAILTREHFSPVAIAEKLQVKSAGSKQIELIADVLTPAAFAGGDHYVVFQGQGGQKPRKITENTQNQLTLTSSDPWTSKPEPGVAVQIKIRLQQPYVDPARCIGCGVCQHECPVKGKRAIRVSAENETRDKTHRLLISG
jgi:polyferredoxin/formate hydrogenlyase subunit 6/NADH:ubiquinone oxidoreductase subunit I